jgi:hypothetical protein
MTDVRDGIAPRTRSLLTATSIQVTKFKSRARSDDFDKTFSTDQDALAGRAIIFPRASASGIMRRTVAGMDEHV